LIVNEKPKEPVPSTVNTPLQDRQKVSTPLWIMLLFLISRYFQLYIIADRISGGIGWLAFFVIFVLGGAMMIMHISQVILPLALILAVFSDVPWWWWIVVIVGEFEMITRYTKRNQITGRNNDD
jgi:hypothetical protein